MVTGVGKLVLFYQCMITNGVIAELAMGNLANILDDLLKQNKGKYTNEDELISECLKQAFDKVVSVVDVFQCLMLVYIGRHIFADRTKGIRNWFP